MQKDRIEFANALRGLAACSVVVSHLLTSFWLDPPVVSFLTGMPQSQFETPAFARVLGALPISWAAFGVGLFFVISGFVIPFSLLRYDARAFLIGRAFRIYPTYWVGLTIAAFMLWLGVHVVGGTMPFNAHELAVHYFPPLRAILFSKPIDGIVWTLEIEIFFYLLCAALARPVAQGRLWVLLVPLAIFVLWAAVMAYVAYAPDEQRRIVQRLNFITIYAPFIIFMFCGVALNFRQRELISRVQAGSVIAVCFGLFFAAHWTGKFVGIIEPDAYAAALLLFVICMALQDRFRPIPWLRWLAEISYPLYVVHGIVGYCALQILLALGAGVYPALAITLALIFVLARLVHRYVELPSQQAGQKRARQSA